MAGNVRVLGKHEHKDSAGGDAPHDCLGPIGPKLDVPRSHPTGDIGRLKMVANSVCYLFVLTRMTNKDLRRHASPVREVVLLDVSIEDCLHKISLDRCNFSFARAIRSAEYAIRETGRRSKGLLAKKASGHARDRLAIPNVGGCVTCATPASPPPPPSTPSLPPS